MPESITNPQEQAYSAVVKPVSIVALNHIAIELPPLPPAGAYSTVPPISLSDGKNVLPNHAWHLGFFLNADAPTVSMHIRRWMRKQAQQRTAFIQPVGDVKWHIQFHWQKYSRHRERMFYSASLIAFAVSYKDDADRPRVYQYRTDTEPDFLNIARVESVVYRILDARCEIQIFAYTQAGLKMLEGLIEFLKLRYTEMAGTDSTPKTINRLPPGRQRDMLYDMAYKRIQEGEPLGEAFKWWRAQQEHTTPEDEDRFRAAMRRRIRGTK